MSADYSGFYVMWYKKQYRLNLSISKSGYILFLNLKTCSVKEIDQFLADNKNYDSDYSRKEWAYLSDVQAIVNRDFFKEDYYFEVRKIFIPEMKLYKCVSLRGHFHPLVDFEV